MDIQLPDMDGLEVTRKLVRYDPKIKIIIISMLSDEPYPSRLLEAGAAGYLSKDCDPQEIIKAIQEVTSGKRYISTLIAQQLALKQITGETSIDKLSLREMQVMMMLIGGKSINEISATFFVTPKTIQACRRQLFRKLKVKSDVQLLLLAKRLGWEKVAQQ
jgi:two-component system invasion response regulator UvrY